MSAADNPIEKASEDLLHRERVAQSISDSLRLVDASRGYVFGILGPWGSGKTSLINLVRERLTAEPPIPVLDFNPWMFSGAEQLLESFFNELAGQLRLKSKRFSAIADTIESYSQFLTPIGAVPFLGAYTGRLQSTAGWLKRMSDARKGTIFSKRSMLVKELEKLDQPIIVVIDDIDRLTNMETREIFKLVRLTASFPNIIYLLAFDRRRVELALTEGEIKGRDYLEKIMQTTLDIPKLPDRLLLTTFGQVLDVAIEDTGARTRFDESRWSDVLAEVVWPLIGNMRDVRRYASSIDAAIRELQDDIELVDLLALEAVRVFMPDTFNSIHINQVFLTQTRSGFSFRGERDEAFRAGVDSLLAIADGEGHREVAVALIRRLFPAGEHYVGGASYDSEWQGNWMRAHRVAHEEYLRRYLERFAGEQMRAFSDAEVVYARFTDQQALEQALDEIDPESLQDVISALEVYQNDYPIESVLPATVALLNKMASIPERERGMWELVDARMVVVRVVLRLLRRLPSESDVEATVHAALPQIHALSARLELITIVGHQENAGHQMIQAESATQLESELADQVVAAAPEDLADERDLMRLLYSAKRFGADIAAYLQRCANPKLNAAVLRDARSFVRSQSFESRTIRKEARLSWDVLTSFFGGDDEIRAVVDDLRTHQTDEDLISIVKLADRYLSGWRPDGL